MWVNCLLLLTVACIQQHRGTKILLESMDEHLYYLDYFYWGAITIKDTTDGEGNGNSLQYSCLENSMDGRA